MIDNNISFSTRDEYNRYYISEYKKTGNREFLTELLKNNKGLISKLVNRYCKDRMYQEDAFQEGSLGLIDAVERFDFDRGYKFSTYASWWIRKYISQLVVNNLSTINYTKAMLTIFFNVRKAEESYVLENKSLPNDYQLAEYTNISLEDISLYRIFSHGEISLDVDAYLPHKSGHERQLYEIIQNENDMISQEHLRKEDIYMLLREQLAVLLDKKKYDVITTKYGIFDNIYKTLPETAAIFKLSKQRIDQIEKESLRILRHKLPFGVRDYE